MATAETQKVSLYLPITDYEMLKMNCRENGTTMNSLIKMLIGQYLEEQEKKKRVCSCCGKSKKKGLNIKDEFICIDCFKLLEENWGKSGKDKEV